MNIWDFVILGIVALAVLAAILSIRKDRKKGKPSCGCGCEGCIMGDSCKKRTN